MEWLALYLIAGVIVSALLCSLAEERSPTMKLRTWSTRQWIAVMVLLSWPYFVGLIIQGAIQEVMRKGPDAKG